MENKTILLIDDLPQNLAVLGNTLKESGYKIIVASSGKAGIHAAQTQFINIILLDIQMPEMDGYEVCENLKKHNKTKDIPVIFLTAKSETESVVKGFEVGGVDYISKPFDKKEVLVRIHNHITLQELQIELKNKNEKLESLLQKEREVSNIKSSLISLASHDLRTPLAVIMSSNQILEEYSEKLSEHAKLNHHSNIDKSTRRMEKMLDNILLYSKAESSKIAVNFEVKDARDFCHKIIQELRSITKEEHIIHLVVEENLKVNIDPTLFEHVILNLLNNAIKYSPDGGAISINVQTKDENAEFIIKDEGVGIPKEEIQYLFTEFFRAENVKGIKGTGIGLSIVKKFVELHNGSIRIKSELNKGSEFIISIPNKRIEENSDFII